MTNDQNPAGPDAIQALANYSIEVGNEIYDVLTDRIKRLLDKSYARSTIEGIPYTFHIATFCSALSRWASEALASSFVLSLSTVEELNPEAREAEFDKIKLILATMISTDFKARLIEEKLDDQISMKITLVKKDKPKDESV